MRWCSDDCACPVKDPSLALIAAIFSSPSSASRTEGVLCDITNTLVQHGHVVLPLVLRDLPTRALSLGDTADPDIDAAVRLIAPVDAVVLTTAVYKAAYAGLLKRFLDLLPQLALHDKVVLPVATGGNAGARPGRGLCAPAVAEQPRSHSYHRGLVRPCLLGDVARQRRSPARRGCARSPSRGYRRVPPGSEASSGDC